MRAFWEGFKKMVRGLLPWLAASVVLRVACHQLDLPSRAFYLCFIAAGLAMLIGEIRGEIRGEAQGRREALAQYGAALYRAIGGLERARENAERK